MFSVTAIVPDSLLDVDALLSAVNEGLDTAARWVQSDFEQTTETWQTKPAFTIETPEPFVREIGTDDPIFGYVNNGTAPHTITPRNGKNLRFNRPFAAKTQKNVIGSYSGNRGNEVVYAKSVVQSIEPREFDETISREWQESDRLTSLIQDAIDRTLT